MPLSDTEREIPLQSPGAHRLPVQSVRGPAWPELINRIWFQRRTVAAWVLVGMAISVVLCFTMGKYEATVQLMPPDSGASGLAGLLPALAKGSGVGSGLLGLAGDAVGIKSTTALFAKVVQSRTVQDKLIDDFHLLTVFGRRRRVDARKELSACTLIDEDKKSGVVSITVKLKDPVLAKDLANAYVRELNAVLIKASNSAAQREEEFIAQRLVVEKKALAEAQQKLSEFSSGSMAVDPPEQIKVTVESAARLQGELVTARAELQGLEQIYTPENVRIKTLHARIGELEQELRKINSGRTGKAGAVDPTYPYPSVKDLPALGTKWADLFRDAKIHETVFEMLTTQHEVSAIQAVKDTPTAKVLDDAVLPEKSYPRPFWIMIIGTLTSVFLSCVGVLLKEKWQTWDETDSRRILLSNMYFGTRNRLNAIRGRRTTD